MKGRASRQKGAAAEREFAELLRRYGFEARRDGRLDFDLEHNVEGYHFEVKRRETLALPEWIKQAERDAGVLVPVVVYRRSREPWRVDLPAEPWLVGMATLRGELNGGRVADGDGGSAGCAEGYSV